MHTFSESVVEEAALEWFGGLGYQVFAGPEIAWGEAKAERSDPEYRDMILEGRVRQTLARLNPDLPPEALDDAFRKLTRIDPPSLVTRNRDLHSMLVGGVNVEYPRRDGSIAGAQAWLVDFENPENNDWLVVNQFTVTEGQHARRPDIVVFLNGLPIAVIELKNLADEKATIWHAFNQIQTYKAEIPSLFVYNALPLRCPVLGAHPVSATRSGAGMHNHAPQPPSLLVIDGLKPLQGSRDKAARGA